MTKGIERRSDLDIARALGSFGVVFTHICQYYDKYLPGSCEPSFLRWVVAAAYCFALTPFLLSAGGLSAASRGDVHSWMGYSRFVGKKFCRLMLPFFSISVMTLAIKVVSPGRGAHEVLPGLVGMVYAPRAGGAPHLWFLYCLLCIFLVWPILRRLVPDRYFVLLWVGFLILAVSDIPWPMYQEGRSVLGIGDLVWYLPVFTLGFLYEQRWRQRWRITPLWILCAAILSASAIAFEVLNPWPTGFVWGMVTRVVMLIGRMCGGLTMIWICGYIARGPDAIARPLTTAGLYSYDVYLLHVALVGNPLVFALSKLHPGYGLAWALFVGVVAVTYLFPIAIAKAIRLSPHLAFVMLGVPMRRRPTGAAL